MVSPATESSPTQSGGGTRAPENSVRATGKVAGTEGNAEAPTPAGSGAVTPEMAEREAKPELTSYQLRSQSTPAIRNLRWCMPNSYWPNNTPGMNIGSAVRWKNRSKASNRQGQGPNTLSGGLGAVIPADAIAKAARPVVDFLLAQQVKPGIDNVGVLNGTLRMLLGYGCNGRVRISDLALVRLSWSESLAPTTV